MRNVLRAHLFSGMGPLESLALLSHLIVRQEPDALATIVCAELDPATGRVHFFGGDLLGMVVAEYLRADAVVVPISCNDAIDRGNLAPVVEPKTRIGSPFVIAGMEAALAKEKKRVCGWEPNGGFLTGSPIARNGAILQPLLTRDAGLPILGVLFAAEQRGLSLVDLFARLPKRFSRAALLKHFPRATALKIVARFSPPGGEPPASAGAAIRKDLALFFTPAMGFGSITHVDYTDGVRILFANGEVAHVRPSGNADELRIYAVADTQSRAFRTNKDLRGPKNLVKCERQLFEKLKALDANELAGNTKLYLSQDEVKAVMARRDKIVAQFQKMISEKGESEVLY